MTKWLPICIALCATWRLLAAEPAVAKPPGDDGWMIRMLVCQGDDATMEVYLPQSVIYSPEGIRAGQTVTGYYTLDLSEANKGKPLEPVRVTLSGDKKTVIVDQFTRKLPPTRIPVGGGTVDFDKRFGTGAKCGPFQQHNSE
jgi:hypothetical protein